MIMDAMKKKIKEKWAADQVSVVNSLKKKLIGIPINLFFSFVNKFVSAAAVYI